MVVAVMGVAELLMMEAAAGCILCDPVFCDGCGVPILLVSTRRLALGNGFFWTLLLVPSLSVVGVFSGGGGGGGGVSDLLFSDLLMATKEKRRRGELVRERERENKRKGSVCWKI